MSHDFIENRPLGEGDLDQALFGLLDPLANGLGNFVGFSQPKAHHSFAVPHDHEGAEAEPAAALDHLGDAVDVGYAINQFQLIRIDLGQ